VLTDLF